MKANRTWTRTASGSALAADSVPSALDTEDDNLLTIRPPDALRGAPPLRGVALVYTGPTATVAVKVHVWEETAEAFVQVAAATLAVGVITRVALPAALDVVTAKPWQSVDVLVTLDGGAATNGAHAFYLWADLGP